MNWITFKIRLFKLDRHKENAYEAVLHEAKAAEKAYGRLKGEEVWQREAYRVDEWNEEIAWLVTSYLLSKANKRFLPYPSYREGEDPWERGHFTGKRYLTEKGISELRSRIRKEDRERFDLFLKIAAGLTGVIGALTGLIAIMKS